MSIANSLKQKGLLIEKAYLCGTWFDCDDKINVINPATEEIIGTVPNTPSDKVLEAIKDSVSAQEHFKFSSPEARSHLLKKWYEAMMQHSREFAELITLENGKTIKESLAEIEYAAAYLKWYAEEAIKDRMYSIPSNNYFQTRVVDYVPVGVTAAVTPWNFPLAMITRKAGAAIAAGCSMLIKPSELTPFTALLMCKLALDSGMPSNLIQVITGDAKRIAEIFHGAYAIRKISFTGSTRIGKAIMKGCSDSLQRVAMELGGNAPLIINSDADPDVMINMVLNGKFRNNGQSCTAVNRILVHESRYEKTVNHIYEKVSRLKVGDGFDENSDLGTVITEDSLNRLIRLIDITVRQGAKLMLGGKRFGNKGYFLEPTIFTEVTNTMEIVKGEIFGPIITIQKFSSEEEAIAMANDTDYGLAAYICGVNPERNKRMAERLNFGMIGINDTRISDAKIPFGGTKNSGFGREGGREGIYEYLEPKYYGIA